MIARIPNDMTAVSIQQYGAPKVLQPTTQGIPDFGKGEVLIQVMAAGVNRPDCDQRMGDYPPPPGASEIPGLEVAGKVVAVSEDVSKYSVGDRVCALVTGGGYAEYVNAHELTCLPVPKGLTMIEAASLPETFFTVWHNLWDRAQLKPDESLLVHGGGSGIGTAAIQIARALGTRVFATAGGSKKCRVCETLGAERAINYQTEDFVSVVQDLTDKRGVDVILDMIGGDYVMRDIESIAIEGRIVFIALYKGYVVEVDFNPILINRLKLMGSTLRAQPVENKGKIGAKLYKHVWPLIEAGKIKPFIDSTFPLRDAARAHAHMESNQHIGKIVLEV